MIPSTPTEVSVADANERVTRLIDRLEELEDLQNVYHTMDITDEIAEALEKNSPVDCLFPHLGARAGAPCSREASSEVRKLSGFGN